jgi:hypothetical protein
MSLTRMTNKQRELVYEQAPEATPFNAERGLSVCGVLNNGKLGSDARTDLVRKKSLPESVVDFTVC